MDTPYTVSNTDYLADEIRKMVLHNHQLPDTEEYVTNREVREICENLLRMEDGKWTCDDKTVSIIMGQTQEAIIQTLLAKASANGDLECEWDDKMGEFKFWMEKEPESNIGKMLSKAFWTPLDTSTLSTRARNILKRLGVQTTQKLKMLDRERLSSIRGAGRKTVDEIMSLADRIG